MKRNRMTRAREKALLLSILASLGGDHSEPLQARLRRYLVSAAATAIGVIVVLGIFVEPNVYKVLLGIIAFCAGFASGGTTFNRYAAEHWPAVARCIDRDKVEARLRELDS